MSRKPPSMSTKDWLVSLTANSLSIPEHVVDHLITWAYLKAKEATLTSASSIEFSGFGKIYVAKGKKKRKRKHAEERLEWLLSKDPNSLNEGELKNNNEKIEKTRAFLKYLDSKTNET